MQRQIMGLVGFMLSWVCLTPFVFSQEADSWTGRRVMVVRPSVDLRSERTVVERAYLGELLAVSQVNGNWLWIESKRGWINQNEVVLSDDAIEHFTQRVDRDATSEAHHQRGIAFAALGQYEKAATDFGEAIRRDSLNLEAYNDRGNALRKIGRLDWAISDFSTLIERNVRNSAVYTNRGLALYNKGEYGKALADFAAAIRRDRKFAPAWEASGTARQAKGEFKRAIDNFRQAIKLDPKFDRAHNNLAWILATGPDEKLRDPEKAIKHATKACELTQFQDAGYLDTLAAAYAEAGQFGEAVKQATKALERAEQSEKPTIKKRLKLYQAGKPYHQGSEENERRRRLSSRAG